MSPQQLPLAAQKGVKKDRTGLHARDCECYGCSIGHGPTEQERWRAECDLERKQIEAAHKAQDTREAAKRARIEAARAARRAQEQRDEEERQRFVPPSQKQMDELKALYPWARRVRVTR